MMLEIKASKVIPGQMMAVVGETRIDIPDWVYSVAVDADGELWGFCSMAEPMRDGEVWNDHTSAEQSRVELLGDFKGGVVGWADSLTVIDREPKKKPKADRRVLRGLVLDSITRDVEAGELGARNTAAIIRDLDVATFNGYTTLKLVQAFALAGYDIRNTHTMKAFEAIDRKVQEAWA
ncbi:hypothetical protein BI040_gp06 [Escherichia phage vB_EcoS_NBD2]|uniref:Uncharacterized protein n=1 Tax=Escherichia phage vB_EcoS_NBD2 TaxID=1852563 RepID=A0A192Y892_9CAUD|nr:hypothetical protein BI040_gp06 [Escherichia phage vB_EcoS_NBD2]ANM45848.1 hypothetical protein NBD2_06 [Escherichia phage vB_EcoS_NBD2]